MNVDSPHPGKTKSLTGQKLDMRIRIMKFKFLTWSQLTRRTIHRHALIHETTFVQKNPSREKYLISWSSKTLQQKNRHNTPLSHSPTRVYERTQKCSDESRNVDLHSKHLRTTSKCFNTTYHDEALFFQTRFINWLSLCATAITSGSKTLVFSHDRGNKARAKKTKTLYMRIDSDPSYIIFVFSTTF